MIMKVILLVSIYPVLPIIYFVMRNEVKPRKNIIIGVTLPYEAREDETVREYSRLFLRELNILCAVLAVLPFTIFLTDYISIVMTIYILWVVAVMAAAYVPYIRYRSKLMQLKKARGWLALPGEVVIVDTKAAEIPRLRIHWAWFALAIAVSLVPLLFADYAAGDWTYAVLYGTNAVMAALFFLFYRIIARQRAEVVDENTALTVALTNIRCNNWGRCWLYSAWLTALLNIALWLLPRTGLGQGLAFTLFTVLLLCVFVWAEFSTRGAQLRLTQESGRNIYIDEDEFWLWGVLYYNPNDRHLMKNDRVGIGASMNLAKPAGKIIMGLAALIMLSLPFICVWMITEEFTPVSLAYGGGQVAALHAGTRYEIDAQDILSAHLRDSVSGARRVSGTGMDTVLKGNFYLEDTGAAKFCLNPQEPPFIEIHTADATYVVGSANPQETEDTYAWLVAEME